MRPEGFEPPTYCSEDSRSIQLSYGRIKSKIITWAWWKPSLGIQVKSADLNWFAFSMFGYFYPSIYANG